MHSNHRSHTTKDLFITLSRNQMRILS
uniref:Uncharacterized protein n=1 Tax=Anguilla anguilla TaxID=7936 RepID=A0A0E9RXC2_ANGAN